MSCEYFILSKPDDAKISDDTENQIVFFNKKKNVYILPANNIKYYLDYGLFEKNLIEWVKQFCHKEKNILDIGSHTGTYTVGLANECNHIYAFEPQKNTYYALCGSVALSNLQNVTCYNVGLGSPDQIGTQVLNIVSEDGGGSSLHANKNKILKTEIIKINTLDSFELTDINFIKMDVEENELYVLKGATETLKRCNYPKILFESNNHNMELFHFIEQLGYSIIKIQNVSNMFLASK